MVKFTLEKSHSHHFNWVIKINAIDDKTHKETKWVSQIIYFLCDTWRKKKIIKVAFLSKIHKFNLIMKKLNKQTNEQKTLRHHLVATAGVVIFEVVWFVFSPLRGTEPSRALSLQEKLFTNDTSPVKLKELYTLPLYNKKKNGQGKMTPIYIYKIEIISIVEAKDTEMVEILENSLV